MLGLGLKAIGFGSRTAGSTNGDALAFAAITSAAQTITALQEDLLLDVPLMVLGAVVVGKLKLVLFPSWHAPILASPSVLTSFASAYDDAFATGSNESTTPALSAAFTWSTTVHSGCCVCLIACPGCCILQ